MFLLRLDGDLGNIVGTDNRVREMTQLHRQAVVPYTPEQMFNLVCAVETYPQFVEACERGEVVERGENYVHARLWFKKGAMQQAFTTKNTLYSPERIEMELVEGPFQYLTGG